MSARILTPAVTQPVVRSRTGWILLSFDLLAVVASLILAIYLRFWYDQSLIWESYSGLWPIFLLFPLVYALSGLYPGISITPPEELRRLTNGTSLVFVLIGASTFMYKTVGEYSRGAFVFAWVLILLTVPLLRALARALWARKPWWGTPVFVFGAGKTGEAVVGSLMRQPGLGLKPVAIYDDDADKQGRFLFGVPVVGGLAEAGDHARKAAVRYAIAAMPGVPRSTLLELLRVHGRVFPHLILIPDLIGFSSLWVSANDLGGVLGLEVRQRLLMPGPRMVKRILDVVLILLASPIILLLGGVVALLVRLDSPGPAVFTQHRPGKDGVRFRILKFRTMFADAEQRFAQLPQELLKEFEQYGKIQQDPRVTRLGYWLRKSSLDEFPQFWNVLRGEMSLVGPRAYLLDQLPQMQGYEDTVLSVLPGVTGLWQVSGRSEVSFEERLAMDSYYVRNWSPWLDLYILARTVWVVLFSRGAY
jgi:Undecaprenyl-phosphate galactose phosphotransferase WbaP